MERYTFGTTPEKTIKELLPDSYELSLPINSDDCSLIINIINRGIDSHLEAVCLENRDYYKINNGRLELSLSKEGMVCLLRRLLEQTFENEEIDINAFSFRTSILSTIGIEEI